MHKFIELEYGIFAKLDCLSPCAFSINTEELEVIVHLKNGNNWAFDFESIEKASEFYHELIKRFEVAELEGLVD